MEHIRSFPSILSTRITWVLLLLWSSCCGAQVPSLDEMAGDWMPLKPLRDGPSISNRAGSVGTADNSVVDVSSFVQPPLVGGLSMLQMTLASQEVPLAASRWSAYEASRRSSPVLVGDNSLVITSHLRMGWNASILLWKVMIENQAATAAISPDRVAVDESSYEFPIQLSAIALAREVQQMGWVIDAAPRDPKEYETVLLPASSTTKAMVIHVDTLSNAASGFACAGNQQPSTWVWVQDPEGRNRSSAIGEMLLNIPPGKSVELSFVASMASVIDREEMADRLDSYASHFEQLWKNAKEEWEKFWMDAFTRPEDRNKSGLALPLEQQLSGHLPVLTTSDEAIRRVYYMGILSLLATNRASLPAFGSASSFVTAHGNTCWTYPDSLSNPTDIECQSPPNPRDPPTGMSPWVIGATAQFYWDTALRSLVAALLDPASLRRYIVSVLSLPLEDFRRGFGIDGLTGASMGYEYAFNAQSVFTIMSTYIQATSDSALLQKTLAGGYTVDERLEEVALDFMRRRLPMSTLSSVTIASAATLPTLLRGTADHHHRHLRQQQEREVDGNDGGGNKKRKHEEEQQQSYLADYGGSINNFLECVPSYLHVPASLQAGNAEMMIRLSDLRAGQGNATGAAYFENIAQALSSDIINLLYIPQGNGTWGCLYPDKQTLIPVRHIIDFIYVTRGLHAGGSGPGLPPPIATSMSAYYHRELETPQWVRALSLEDDLNLRTPRPSAILRPDHGVTGAYDAWAALSIEALAINDGNWISAVHALRKIVHATKEGPFGQAHELTGVNDQEVFKTKRGFTRHTADNGASFSEVVIRGLFGYSPMLFSHYDASLPYRGLENALDRSLGPPADFEGTLTGLRTPWGIADLDVGSEGLVIKNLVE